MSSCNVSYGLPWSILAPMIAIYITWRHMVGIGAYIFSTSAFTRKMTIAAGIKMLTLWQNLRSYALVKVTWKTSANLFKQPIIRFVAGHGGGGRTCGSLLVYSPPLVGEEPTKPKPFDD